MQSNVKLRDHQQESVFYHMAKFLNRELKPLTTTAPSFIKDTKKFVTKIKVEKLEEGEKLVSFDIVDMYLLLPKTDVLNEIIRRIKEETFKGIINKQALIKLAKLVINFDSF